MRSITLITFGVATLALAGCDQMKAGFEKGYADAHAEAEAQEAAEKAAATKAARSSVAPADKTATPAEPAPPAT